MKTLSRINSNLILLAGCTLRSVVVDARSKSMLQI